MNYKLIKKLVKKALVLIAASLVTISLFACGGKTETKMEYPSISIDQDVETGDDNKVNTIDETIKPPESKEETTKLPEIIPDKKDMAKAEEKFNSEFGKNAIKVNSEEEVFAILEKTMEPILRARKDFLEHNGVIELPQSEWGPVYNADGSDPYICPGSQLRAYNSCNPMGKNGYELRNGAIVPKEEALPYPDPLEDIKIGYVSDIEYRVFLKNNPGITLRKSMDGWGSFDRWTYIEYGPYRGGCFPKWDEKVIPMKTGLEMSRADESTLFHVAGDVYGSTDIMDHELDWDATHPKMQALKYAAPSPIIDYKHDPEYTQEYVIDVSKTKWAK